MMENSTNVGCSSQSTIKPQKASTSNLTNRRTLDASKNTDVKARQGFLRAPQHIQQIVASKMNESSKQLKPLTDLLQSLKQQVQPHARLLHTHVESLKEQAAEVVKLGQRAAEKCMNKSSRRTLLCCTSLSLPSGAPAGPSTTLSSVGKAGDTNEFQIEPLDLSLEAQTPQTGPSSSQSRPPNKVALGSAPKGRRKGSSRILVDDGSDERTLISEVLVTDLEGQEIKDPALVDIVKNSLKASKPNLAMTVREVKEDVQRIIDTGYFNQCLPIAEDTRDGVRLFFRVEPPREMTGVQCNGANALPTKIIQDAFKVEMGKWINVQRLNTVLDKINGWYQERGLFGQVTDVTVEPDGIINVDCAEVTVNDINIAFRDRKTGEITKGKTRPETLLRQLTTKPGQVYNMLQGRRDIDTLITMGIMEDVNFIPQPTQDPTKVDVTMNVVERVPGGFSAGGGISGNSIANGALSALIGSFTYSHKNAFGRNQKLLVLVERGQFDSTFKFNYTDPWLEGDDKRTSRSLYVQNSRTPGTTVHGIRREGQSGTWHGGVTIGRLIASLDFSRPLRPKWSGTAGLSFQRVGARDNQGQPMQQDTYGSQLTYSGKATDDMLVAKLETVYTSSGDNGSSQLVVNTEQGLPVADGWLFFNRVNVRARQGFRIGPVRSIASFSGGTVAGELAPHEAFAIGGTNSVRGYDEGAVGSGRSFVVASGEISVPLFGPVEGAFFADYGSDLGSGAMVLGDPAGARGKPGTGSCVGAGIRIDSPLGPLRLEYALNDQKVKRFHFGIGYRN